MVRYDDKLSQKIDELNGLEEYIQTYFQPIKPRPNFVASLGKKLLNTPIPANRWITVIGYTALVSAGLISGAIILATGVRAVLAIIGAIGIFQQIKAQKIQNRLA